MKSSFLISDVEVRKISAELIYPFRTALGQHDDLENVLLRLKLDNGIDGWGEAAIAPHITGETVAATLANLQKVCGQLIGQDVRKYRKISSQMKAALSENPASWAAVEMAVLDGLTKIRGIPLWRFFGPRERKIATDITIVISSLQENEGAVKVFYRRGFRAFKVKIGRDQDLDVARVLMVQKNAPRSKIYLDANQGYSADDTIAFLKILKRQGLRPDLIEQPVPKGDWEGLRRVTAEKLAPVCADESVRSLADCRRLIKEKAADVINIKIMKSGFLEGAQIAKLARRHGIKLMMGAMMESNLAITAAAHFAAGLGVFDFIDLDPPFFIRGGPEANPHLSDQGVYHLKKVKAGIGIDGHD